MIPNTSETEFCIACKEGNLYLNYHHSHSICNECLITNQSECPYCLCISCKVSKAITKYEKCGHPSCEDCLQYMCRMCIEKCFICHRQAYKFTRDCENHGFCMDCYKNYNKNKRNSCVVCEKGISECFRCKENKFTVIKYCDSDHEYCFDCKNFPTCRCIKCEICSKVLECFSCDNESHNVCGKCYKEVPCRACLSLEQILKNRRFY